MPSVKKRGESSEQWTAINLPIAHCQNVTFVVGDVHGQSRILEEAVVSIRRRIVDGNALAPTIVFLGDLIDRGPGIFETLNIIRHLRRDFGNRVFVIRGNHERTFMGYALGFLTPRDFQDWIELYGGGDTLAACGIDVANARLCYRAGVAREMTPLAARLFDFCSRTIDFIRMESVICVHEPECGERIRRHNPSITMMVHGHVIQREVVLDDDHRLGLDLGSYCSQQLAVLQFGGGVAAFTVLRASARE